MRITIPGFRVCLLLLSGVVLSMASVGCQSTIGGQTLPSSNYLRDDVQFFAAGPEDILHNARRTLEQHNVEYRRLKTDVR